MRRSHPGVDLPTVVMPALDTSRRRMLVGACAFGVLGALGVGPSFARRAVAQDVGYTPFAHEQGPIARNARLELNGRTMGLVRIDEAKFGPRLDLVPPSAAAASGVATVGAPYPMEFSWGMHPDFYTWLDSALLPKNPTATIAIVRRLVSTTAGAPVLDYRVQLEGARLASFSWRSTTRESGFPVDALQHGRNEFGMSVTADRASVTLEPAMDPARWGRHAASPGAYPPQRALLLIPGLEQHALLGHSLHAQRMGTVMDPRSLSPWAFRFEALLPGLSSRLFPWIELFRSAWTGGPTALSGMLRFYAEGSAESQASLDLREISPLQAAPAGAGPQVATFMCRSLTPRLASLKPL